jgi:hypothetical protein
MATNLTGTTIASTYDQLLHVDDGPTATEKTVYSGTGVATALKVGTTSASVGNVQLSGNTVQAITGDLTLGSNIAFASQTNARTALGLGTMATQNSGAVAITGGAISNVTFTGSFVGITLIESDKFSTKNGGDGVSLESNNVFAEGTSTNLDLDIAAKGTGSVNFASKFGYGTGTGGAVTQLTSKSTGVTLDKLSGQITMHNAQLNRNTGVSFVLTNSFIAATDVVIVNIVSGATNSVYTATIDAVAAGSCRIHLHNHTTGTDYSEAVVLNFVVIKGVSA